MKCFNHPDLDAVAQCRGCAKFLCRSCSHEGRGGIACSDECRVEVENSSQLHDRLMARSSGRTMQTGIVIAMYVTLMALMGTWVVGIIWSAFKAAEER